MAEMNDKLSEATESAEPKAEAKKAAKKDKKPNFFVRTWRKIVKFCRDCRSEMNKVVWLSRKETMKNSLTVIVVVAALGLLIGVIDLGLGYGVQGLAALGKLINL